MKRALIILILVISLLTVVPVLANPGWVSPTGFSDPSSTWTSETLCYDEDTGTYAYTSVPKSGWGGYLELSIAAIDCDKVRGWFDIGIANVSDFELDVYYSGDWQNIHTGSLPLLGQYVEFPIGGTQSVSGMRFRFYSTKADADGGLCYEADFWEVEGTAAPTVTTSAATNIEATTATLNGNVTDTGGEDPTVTVYWGDEDGGEDPGSWDNNSVPTSPAQPQGVASFYKNATGLPTGTTLYFNAKATNSGGTAWGTTQSFLTKPAAPTSVAATDGDYTDKVTITWVKSTGATDYQVYRDGTPLGWAGDVATFDDTGAGAPTITPGSTVATDGDNTAHVSLSLSGASTSNGATHTYKVRAKNATGESADSATNTGYRGVGALTYQWQRSGADSDAGYSNIGGATASTYDDTAAPAPTITPGSAAASDGDYTDYVALSLSGQSTNVGDGRYYKCILNATGATQQTSSANRGHRGVGSLTYQWQRSAADSDADYSNIGGATTASYNDTGAPADGSGRYYQCVENAAGATEQISTSNRGYRATLSSPAVSTQNATDIHSDTALLHGTITDTGGQNADERGFEWGLESGIYTDNWTEAGSFGIGGFEHEITGLPILTQHFFRAMAHNDAGWGYGGEFDFTTTEFGSPPLAPANFTLTDLGGITISANWTAPENTDNYLLLVDRDDYPTSANSTIFEVAFSDNLTSANLTGYALDVQGFFLASGLGMMRATRRTIPPLSSVEAVETLFWRKIWK